MRCRIYSCQNLTTETDDHGPICDACADELALAEREEYEAAAEEAEEPAS